MVNIVKVAGAIFCLTCCSGCVGLSHLMYNYMCDPYGQCGAECQQPQALGMMPGPYSSAPVVTQPYASAETPAPAVSADVSNLQEEVRSIKDANEMLLEKLSRLDKRADDQESGNEKIADAMGKVAENLRYMSDRIDEKEVEFTNLVTHVQERKDRRDRELDVLEQAVNDLITELDRDATGTN